MWTQEQEEIIKNNYGKIRYKELSLMVDKPIHQIAKKVGELGIKFPAGKNPTQVQRGRKTTVNEDFFSIPNSINSYWAGFLAADGNIRNSRDKLCLSLQISLKDVQHLEKFVSIIQYSGKVSKYTRKNGISMCNINIISNKICNDLEKNFNLIPKKSLVLKPPNILSDEQKDCFIAGYIDGDGCIRQIRANNKLHTSLDARGTYEITNYIKDRFLEITKNYDCFGNVFKCGSIGQEKKDKDLNKNHFRYKITGRAADIVINKYIQYDIPLLERKWLSNLKEK